MAHTASDGKSYTNLPPMRAHQKMIDSKKSDPLAQPQGEEQGGGESPEQVVAQHGPAREVHIAHAHASGKHHVHSIHEDGHEHHSDHASPEEAHHRASALAAGTGMGDENPAEDEGSWE